MKNWWIAMICAVGIVSLQAEESEAIFERANAYFAAEAYDSAFYLYEGLVLENLQDASLFYNFGNTLFQLGRKAEAIAYYEKALKISPQDEAIQNNLSLVREQLGLPDEQESGWLYRLRRTQLVAILAIASFWCAIFLGLGGLMLAQQKWRWRLWITAIIALSIALFMAFQTWLKWQEAQPNSLAIAIEDARMFAQPASISPEVYEISIGQKIKLLKKSDNWYYVTASKNRKGWVHSSSLIVI